MKTNLTSIGTAAVAATMLLAGSAHAAAKPTPGKSAAPSLDAAGAKVGRYAEAHGALGSYYDAATKKFVIVGAQGSSLAQSKRGAPATVRTRAISKRTVDTLQDRIAKRAWSPAAKNYNYASWLDLKTGKLVLQTNAPRSVTAELSKGYTGVIEQQDGAIRDSFSRRADTSPFWGGSSIKSGGSVCSSGFIVQRGGQRFMVTAGHCFAVGANATTTDGNLSVGNVTQRGPFLPWPLQSFDMELIAGASYGSSIFVGGTNSSTGKHVNGAGDPVVGFAQYCRSGQTSGEQCGQTVQSVDAQVCTQTGCKSPVISYTGQVSQPGDSGAPFYVHSVDGSNVFIRGLNVASGGSTSFAEKWSRISSNLGVSIVT